MRRVEPGESLSPEDMGPGKLKLHVDGPNVHFSIRADNGDICEGIVPGEQAQLIGRAFLVSGAKASFNEHLYPKSGN